MAAEPWSPPTVAWASVMRYLDAEERSSVCEMKLIGESAQAFAGSSRDDAARCTTQSDLGNASNCLQQFVQLIAVIPSCSQFHVSCSASLQLLTIIRNQLRRERQCESANISRAWLRQLTGEYESIDTSETHIHIGSPSSPSRAFCLGPAHQEESSILAARVATASQANDWAQATVCLMGR